MSNAIAVSDMIGATPRFRNVIDEVDVVAPATCAVLLLGETGTGKEVIARAIHAASPRRKSPFVALNCSAIPGALMESELYGHERGAFTGALTRTVGRFEAADHGTLFLDEIGDLPLELQPKLLRVLQEQQFERLGSTHSVRVDVRVIAATHQNLWQMVQAGRFRADLYYRLSVYPIHLPPLRERREDIPLLIEYFVNKFAARLGRTISHIPVEGMEGLKSYDWPGNIRELQNFVERCVIRTSGPVLRVPLSELVTSNECSPPQTLADAHRAHIVRVLRETNWVVGGPGGAAERLGLPRTTLIGKMNRLGIVRDSGPVGSEIEVNAWSAASSS